MRILLICPDSPPDAPLSLQSLDYLGHQIESLSIDRLRAAGTTPGSTSATSATSRAPATVATPAATIPEADVVVADASVDLSLAPLIASVLSAAEIDLPVIVVLGEGGLAAASAKWTVSDIVLSTAGPGEVEARLRLARDRHLARAAGGHAPAGALPGAGSAQHSGLPWSADFPSGDQDPAVVVIGTLRIDETAFTADLGGRSLDLTYREFALLKFFASHPERVFTRDEILLSVWGDDYYGGTRTVDVHVRRLRAKLGKDLENAIHTVRNVGYRFSPDAAIESDEDSDTEEN
ncbi:winged-helix domain-containing protein [Brevibacterium sp.]|uniref:winged helix-turn-helix domain-containing protein n=1 Tax=Brevibacterium sp. TaxID=1701 RepID=UPI0028125158|nr:winged-helix domain-containing protein [Brevibacterium sp.]